MSLEEVKSSLKMCPFCHGSDVSLCVAYSGGTSGDRHNANVMCLDIDCLAHGPHSGWVNSKEEAWRIAAEAWNKAPRLLAEDGLDVCVETNGETIVATFGREFVVALDPKEAMALAKTFETACMGVDVLKQTRGEAE